MIMFKLAGIFAVLFLGHVASGAEDALPTLSPANRYCFLDQPGPYQVDAAFPRLVTPQWIDEPEVEAVVVLAIMGGEETVPLLEGYLRPLLDFFAQKSRPAPISLFVPGLDPENPQVRAWVEQGVTLEAQAGTKQAPFFQTEDFEGSKNKYLEMVDLLGRLPMNTPVASRLVGMDRTGGTSPRFFAEVLNDRTPAGGFLRADSSVMTQLASTDEAPPALRFGEYAPDRFANAIPDYPYPYVVGRLIWEFPSVMPSDWQSAEKYKKDEVTIEAWNAALDRVIAKQGLMTLSLHADRWISFDRLAHWIEEIETRHAGKIRFLTLREVLARIDQNMLGGQPLRDGFGRDNGVRVLDLNNDGYLDVILGDGGPRRTRVWNPETRSWRSGALPTGLIQYKGADRPDGVRVGVDPEGGRPLMVGGDGPEPRAWVFENGEWKLAIEFLNGLPVDVAGLRFRDVNGDGRTEALMASLDRLRDGLNGVYGWSSEEKKWQARPYGLPPGAWTAGLLGLDAGLRFIDLNQDGKDDVVFSNDQSYGVYLFENEETGWSRRIVSGKASEAGALPPIVREFGTDNGFWTYDNALWWANEETGMEPGGVQRIAIEDLLKMEASKAPNATEPRTEPETEVSTQEVEGGRRP